MAASEFEEGPMVQMIFARRGDEMALPAPAGVGIFFNLAPDSTWNIGRLEHSH
jgi:hypothetical protein